MNQADTKHTSGGLQLVSLLGAAQSCGLIHRMQNVIGVNTHKGLEIFSGPGMTMFDQTFIYFHLYNN